MARQVIVPLRAEIDDTVILRYIPTRPIPTWVSFEGGMPNLVIRFKINDDYVHDTIEVFVGTFIRCDDWCMEGDTCVVVPRRSLMLSVQVSYKVNRWEQHMRKEIRRDQDGLG